MRASVSTAQDLGMPAIYLHLLAELLNTIGVDEQDLLLRVGLDPVRLQSTDRRVSQTQASEFVTRAIIESGEPGLDNGPGDYRERRTGARYHARQGAEAAPARRPGYGRHE